MNECEESLQETQDPGKLESAFLSSHTNTKQYERDDRNVPFIVHIGTGMASFVARSSTCIQHTGAWRRAQHKGWYTTCLDTNQNKIKPTQSLA